jgi:DNA segregation ATPase FtsK/SpoIIIE, S-DNA-T family
MMTTEQPDVVAGDLVPVDAERSLHDPGELGGPVDPPIVPRTLYATVVDRGQDERAPIVPAWLRNGEQRAAFARETVRFVAYVLTFHTVRLPKYAVLAAVYAPWGVLRLAGRQISWWWVMEQHSVRQHAASKNDAEMWMKLHREAKRTRAGRGMWLAGEALALLVAVTMLRVAAPLLVQVAVVAVATPVLARYGRPAGRPITDRVYAGPRFTRLHAEMVRLALCSIGVAGIKEPAAISFPPPGIHRDGPGWLARVNLPPGVEAVKVMEARGALSSALRLPVDQVWPAAGPDHAGQLDLWVGYLPASKMGQPRWSLLADTARTSVFDSHEFGTDQRQRPVVTGLFARNFLIGGVPGSGKSYGARALASIALLDPTCEMKIAEFKGTGDFADMAPLCSTYICGVDDTSLEAGRTLILWGLAEAERRGERIRRAKAAGLAPEGKVTPELAAKPGSGLHPVCIVIDEAHELFLHDKEIAVAAERLIKRGRALGIIIILATQIPDSKSVPPNITRCVTVRWCLAVQDQVANDMILGTGAYKRGLSAAVYRPVVDAGWGVATGLETPGPVRSHFPDPHDAAALVARAAALRGGVVAGDDELQTRDMPADVLRVFCTYGRRLHWEQVAQYLAELEPAAYRSITAEVVSAAMRAAGVPSEDVKVNRRTAKGAKIEHVQAAVDRRQLGAEVAAPR